MLPKYRCFRNVITLYIDISVSVFFELNSRQASMIIAMTITRKKRAPNSRFVPGSKKCALSDPSACVSGAESLMMS